MSLASAATGNDYIGPVLARLTYNGAVNLRGALRHPHERFPDLINGGRRVYTGSGKWTHIAAVGVIRHLTALGLVSPRYLDWNNDNRGWESLVITPLGREVAERLDAEWDELVHTLRDCSGRY